MDVVDKLGAVATDSGDRPKSEVSTEGGRHSPAEICQRLTPYPARGAEKLPRSSGVQLTPFCLADQDREHDRQLISHRSNVTYSISLFRTQSVMLL